MMNFLLINKNLKNIKQFNKGKVNKIKNFKYAVRYVYNKYWCISYLKYIELK